MTLLLAIGLPFDPSATVAGAYAGWIIPAQNIARTIYMGLIIFDLIALAVTTLLFRENLGEFVSSIALKVLMGGIFFFLIANGPNLTSAVINYFKNASTNFGGNPGTGPDIVVAGFLTAAAFYFTAASLATGVGDTTAIATGASGLGFGDVGSPLAAIFGPESFILSTEALGLMVTLGAFAILLQFSIVTIESYLVMSVGTLMIGFAGSRFTLPFSQGYFSYMINVGIKLMVTYIILGVVAVSIIPIVLSSGATVLVGAALPYGGFGTSIVALILTAFSAAYVVLVAGVIWTIPAFTAALLTGQSQSSGSAILQQAIGAFAGAAQMFSQFGAAGRALADSKQGNGNGNEAGRSETGSSPLGAGSQTMSPAQSHDSFAPNGSSPAATPSGDGGALGGIGAAALPQNGPINPSTGMSYDNALPATSESDRSDADRERARMGMAYGLSGAAQAAPREIGAPTAVQVRLANPDKL